MHYAGRLVIKNYRTNRVTHIGGGYAACCSGERAVHIAEEGHNTRDQYSVTCKSCLAQIARAEFTSRMSPNIKGFF